MGWFKESISEDNKQASSIRVINYWVAFWFVLALTMGFVYSVIQYKEIIIVYAGILATAITTVLTVKAWQKGKEADVNTPVK